MSVKEDLFVCGYERLTRDEKEQVLRLIEHLNKKKQIEAIPGAILCRECFHKTKLGSWVADTSLIEAHECDWCKTDDSVLGRAK